MNIKKVVLLICLLCTILCGCKHNDKIVIVVPAGNPVTNPNIVSAGNAFDTGDYYTALNNYLEAEKIYSNEKYPNGKDLAEIYSMIGRCYVELDEYHKAKDYFEKSLSFGDITLYQKLYFEDCYNLLRINYLIEDGDLDLALQYGEKAEKAAISYYGYLSSELGDVYSEIGVVYSHMGKFDKADKYMHKALKKIGKNNESSAVIYKQMSDMYIKQEQYDIAEDYLKKAEKISKKKNNEHWLAVVYVDLGKIYWNKKEYDNAIDYYNKGIDVYNQSGKVEFDLAKCHFLKAEALYKSKNIKIANKK